MSRTDFRRAQHKSDGNTHPKEGLGHLPHIGLCQRQGSRRNLRVSGCRNFLGRRGVVGHRARAGDGHSNQPPLASPVEPDARISHLP